MILRNTALFLGYKNGIKFMYFCKFLHYKEDSKLFIDSNCDILQINWHRRQWLKMLMEKYRNDCWSSVVGILWKSETFH